MKKGVVLFIVVLVVVIFGRPALEAWMMSVPATSFDDTPLPPAPDYSNPDNWSALPDRDDSADWLPSASDYRDRQAEAEVDVFYVHPTAAFYGDYWVASIEDNLLHRVAVDYGIMPQQASAFNGAGRVFAPRYRSVRMPIWTAEDQASMKQATALAYDDVKNAFAYYMQHWNNGRPLIIASHSQGTLHTIRLLREEFDGKPLAQQLVAAYLVGNTIADVPWFQQIPLCENAEQTGCYATWNTLLEGGDPYHWVGEKGLERIDCVNPLSWKADQQAVAASENNGSIPMAGYRVARKDIGPLHTAQVGARCGEEGILWIAQRPSASGYSSALFENGYGYHTYDFNLYYDSIRRNAQLRAARFLEGG